MAVAEKRARFDSLPKKERELGGFRII